VLQPVVRWLSKEDIKFVDVPPFSKPDSIWFILGTGIVTCIEDGTAVNFFLKLTGVFSRLENVDGSCETGSFRGVLIFAFLRLSL